MRRDFAGKGGKNTFQETCRTVGIQVRRLDGIWHSQRCNGRKLSYAENILSIIVYLCYIFLVVQQARSMAHVDNFLKL